MTKQTFLGRQPILDRDGRTFGYELLYRDGPDGGTLFEDPDDATRQVMERALLHWGMERIIGDHFGLINASPSLVLSGLYRSMPPEGIIFEIPERAPFDDATFDAIRAARREGYHFALDNVSDLPELERSRLLPMASIVKIEPSRTREAELPRLVKTVGERSPGALIVAEKVETRDDLTRCAGLGIDLFQGYFFAVPEVLAKAARPASSASAMTLLAEMQRADIDIPQIEMLVATDPSLAYRLLAVVNSSAFGLDRRVDSLRHAIVLLGLNQVRHLAVLLALSTAREASEELLTTGAVRARLASILVDDPELRSAAFTVGLLSITDAIFNTPMEELVDDLPLSDEIVAALLDRSGPLGATLRLVLACEQADVAELHDLAPAGIARLHAAYGASVLWAEQLRGQVYGSRRGSRLRLRGESTRPLART